ncbi:helix-turn-helix domain-containing protein [Luteimonas fraxinea]|uniref:helix-turn-helix domain-containing protein n=1 Tax=Luteimonas fraxinea TaxID=2901869 RepID=UPI003CCCD11E
MSERIRSARRSTGLSQTRFAERVGVHRSAVAQWERPGGCNPSLEKLVLITVVSGVGMDWLVSGRAPERSLKLEGITAVSLEYLAKDSMEERALVAVRSVPASSKIKFVDQIESTSAALREEFYPGHKCP